MLRKIVLVGLFAGGSASVPVLWQTNPELFQSAVKAAFEERAPEPEPQRPLIVVQQAKVEPRSEQPVGRKVRLEGDEQGHFNAQFKVNGRSIDGMVDTGASMIAINVSTARRLGLSLGSSDFRHPVTTANGTIMGAIAQLETVQIGRIQVKGVDAMVLEDRALSGTLVGMSFLSRLSSFRIENGVLVMEQ
jgi:aspartyl protease family protein